MTDFIKTQRLEIKPFFREDEEALAHLLVNEQIRKTYMIPDFASREALDRMVGRFLDLSRAEDRFVRGIYLEDRLIGFVNDVEMDQESMELGYVIHPDFWGQGYATEMLGAVMAALLARELAVIRTGAFCENRASIRVMEKCGMEKCPETERIAYRGAEHICVYYEKRT